MIFQKILMSFILFSFYVKGETSDKDVNFFELEWEHYTSEGTLQEQLKNYVFVKGDYSFNFTKSDFSFRTQLKYQYSLDHKDWFHFDLPEIFLFYKYDFKTSFKLLKSIEFYLGRKVKKWSLGDDYWDLGLWNSLILWNPLEPMVKGNVGSFLTFKSENWETDFFLGALHIPNTNANFFVRDKTPRTYSRWGTLLPNKVDEYNLSIYYEFIKPFYFDFINKKSFFVNFKTWTEKSDIFCWFKISFADKPTNHLYYIMNKKHRLKVDSNKSKEPLFIDQVLTGIFSRQRILSTEWGINYNKILSMTVSLENTKIKEEKALDQENWSFINSRESFTYFSGILKYQYSPESFFELGFIQSWFNKYRNQKNTVQPVFVSQNKILNGLSLAFEKRSSTLKGLPLIFNLKYQYSFLGRGAWLSTNFLYYMGEKFYTKWSAHILGSGVKNQSQSFLSIFKHNDYFTWSFVYDF
ncbi:MAG: hypothetical protein GDA46_02505 [Bdellovibrionales bacterium]|nr:hypothetical protein [Bdellovibrionales bacterium]